MDLSRKQLSALAAARREVPPILIDALAAGDAYLVGGAVRDALAGIVPGEIDIAVEQEPGELLGDLAAGTIRHPRFGTATVEIDGRRIDLAQTRSESYRTPGALPEVSPAPIEADLGRRDFSVNAMAVPLRGELGLLDPYSGLEDLEAQRLRALHPDSFLEDPTRALRAARYCARLGLAPEPRTARMLQAADLSTISADRVAAELERLAAEPNAIAGFRLLDGWGVLDLGAERLALLEGAERLLRGKPWIALLDAAQVLPRLAAAPPARLRAAGALAAIDPGEPNSARFEAALAQDDELLLIARALGADWIDLHLGEWRELSLAIDGSDLISAGVEQGPEIGLGLRAARAARLDGRIAADRESELDCALGAIRAAR